MKLLSAFSISLALASAAFSQSVQGGSTQAGAVTSNSTATLTNKTINGANNTLTVRAANDITGVLPGSNGGTGVANSGKSITLGGNLTTSGAFATTLTATATTGLTLPTTGTLSTLAGTEAFSNKTLTSSTNNVFPIGTISDTAADAGTWLQMNGQVVTQSTYASLFKLIGHQPEFTWTASTQFGVSTTVNSVAFGNSTYVAVLNNGNIYTSADRLTWTSRTSGVATALFSVCWDSDNSLFVAVGASNVILTSPEGTNWTSRTSGVTSTLTNVIHKNSRTVAVGTGGYITYSTNDTAWTASAPNASPTYAWLLYLNSTWFSSPSGSASSGILYSTDGTTWNFVSKPTTNNFNFAGADATYFYVADSTTGEVWRSTTGATWASVNQTLNWFIPGGMANPAYFSGGTIALVAGANNTVGSYTANGYTSVSRLFQSPTTQTINSSIILSGLYGNMTAQNFAIVGVQSGTTAGNVVPAYSVDGKTWHAERFSPGFSQTNQQGLYNGYANGVYFILENAGRAQVLSAPEPYTPSTQFQIPTRKDTTGTALWIKAL